MLLVLGFRAVSIHKFAVRLRASRQLPRFFKTLTNIYANIVILMLVRVGEGWWAGSSLGLDRGWGTVVVPRAAGRFFLSVPFFVEN